MVDSANPLVAGVTDIQVAAGIECHAAWIAELSAGGRATIAAESRESCTGERGDGSVGGDLANCRVQVVHHVLVAGRINRDRPRSAELRGDGRAAVP